MSEKQSKQRRRFVEGLKQSMGQVETGGGVLLPGVDPMVAELAFAALQANPTAHPAAVAAALARTAPDDDLATELVSAVFELVLCGKKGSLTWVEETTGAYLTGSRRVPGKDGIVFGVAEWPLRALAAGPPHAVTIRMPDGPRVAWVASTGLDGAMVRASEAVAIGNAIVERLGGRIIEDRNGPDVMRKSAIELAMTDRAKNRAAAMSRVDRMTVESRTSAYRDHARVAIIEGIDGCLSDGTLINPEDNGSKMYTVERRVNESWVIARAMGPGAAYDVAAGTAWVLADGKDLQEGVRHCGFSEEAAEAPAPEAPDLTRAMRIAAMTAPDTGTEEPTGG